jgi:DNA polymerase-3 subunit alpha
MEVQWAVRLGRTIDDPTWERLENQEYFLRSSEEMRELFVDYPDAVANTVEIAERCSVVLKRNQYLLPEFPLPEGFDGPNEYLAHLSREGVVARYGVIDDRIRQRLEYELGVIRDMKFAGYFLITGDFVKAARDRGIPVGPGRGSAAGSLVCYSIGITDIDPLEHDLLFERFLNRTSTSTSASKGASASSSTWSTPTAVRRSARSSPSGRCWPAVWCETWAGPWGWDSERSTGSPRWCPMN